MQQSIQSFGSLTYNLFLIVFLVVNEKLSTFRQLERLSQVWRCSLYFSGGGFDYSKMYFSLFSLASVPFGDLP